ncbi:hypothetical protein YDYSG_09230 [Paenibacillus tyrfis]|uniref:hypothetical protein n=1 Tax=Paenibacillus tyrfis TaxID=1501230 RepID=UPI002492BBEB|nr:hypothetical protein [Paenibacillus tyrfis]GLI04893.1 hypothetical protein YDYSG_09230 [Paenibacillus tyrfis]
MTKKHFIFITTAVVFFLTLYLYEGKKVIFSNSANSANEKLTQINFPEVGGGVPHEEFQVELDKVEMEKVRKINSEPSYFKHTSDSQIEDKVAKLKEAFNIQASGTKNELGTKIEDEKQYLEVFNNGVFHYHNKHRNESISIDVTDEKAKEIATDFLKKNNLLPNDFTITSVAHETLTNAKNPNDKKVLRKEVYFNRLLNGTKVYGISRIIVSIGDKGQIDTVFSLNRPIDPKGNPIKLKSIDNVIDDLKKLKGTVKIHSDSRKVKINKIELSYWEDSTPTSTQEFIQPVYHLKGDNIDEKGITINSSFEAFISAIPDEFITPAIVPELKPSDKKPDTSFEKNTVNIPKK